MKKLMIVLLLTLFGSTLYAAPTSDIYSFDNDQQKTQFENLTQQLRCLVCQNETLADSNAPLAQDLRGQVAVLIKQNKSNDEIIHYLVQRYGDFILFKPPLKSTTYLLWFGPFVLLLVGFAIIIIWIRKLRNHKIIILTTEQKKKLKEIEF